MAFHLPPIPDSLRARLPETVTKFDEVVVFGRQFVRDCFDNITTVGRPSRAELMALELGQPIGQTAGTVVEIEPLLDPVIMGSPVDIELDVVV